MFPIGEAARQTGVAIETIRYYERVGIVPRPDRTGSGRRVYDETGLLHLRFVKLCRNLGFSIADSKALLDLATRGGRSCGDALPIARAHLDDLDSKLAELTMLREGLASFVDQCVDPDAPCPMLTTLLDAAASPKDS